MRRGGCVILQISELFHGESFPDLSLVALGAWVRLRAASELTGEPIGKREVDRLGIGAEILAELTASRVVEDHDGAVLAVGMPEPERKPSDQPTRIRERVTRYRDRKRQAPLEPLPSGQVRSDQVRGNAVTRYEPLHRATEDGGGLKARLGPLEEIMAKKPKKGSIATPPSEEVL